MQWMITAKTYNTRNSLVVTDPTTDLALTGLSMGERTGSRVLQWVWSYVSACCLDLNKEGVMTLTQISTISTYR